MSSDLLRRIEQAAVRGWPAIDQSDVDGWIWRHTSGGSVRANSVATLAFHGDPTRAIATCERRYAERGATCVFTINDVTLPTDLDAILAARGYSRGEDHVTMAKAVASDVSVPASITTNSFASSDWMQTYLSGLTENRRVIAPTLIAQLPPSAVFISDGADGRVTSSGLTIVDGTVASVQCMATLVEARRRGGARRVLAAIESIAADRGATHLYLQTGDDNYAARAGYEASGYRVLGRYHTRTRCM